MLENFHKTSGAQLIAAYIKDSPQKAALALQSVSLSEAVFWLSSLTLADLTAALTFMDNKKAAVILRRLPLKQGARALLTLNPQKAGEVLNYVPPFYKKRLEGELTPEELKIFKEAKLAPKNTIASIIKPAILTFKTDAKIEEILQKIKNLPKTKIPQAVYILDKQNRLCGIIKTSVLAILPPNTSCGSVMEKPALTLNLETHLSKAKQILMQNKISELPVVNKENILCGELSVWEFPQKTQISYVKRLLCKLK
ncbi:MAG: CBS domain-containing protein [Elusimicrobiaceae bacterium]|nr:CBS domain-containing protein [Elusimicrobiaceae bacterium]